MTGPTARRGIDRRALVGIVVLAAGLLLWAMAFLGGGIKLPFSGGAKTTVRADFATIESVVKNDPVRIHGVQVGRVSKAERDPGGRGGTLTLKLSKSAGIIYRNATVSILWRTALGANEAVALDPGTPAAGPLGGATIPQSQTSSQVELDEVTQSLHDGAQPGLRTMIQQLGPAFSDHHSLGHGLSTLSQVAPVATVGIGALRGVVPDTDLRELVKNAGDAAQALDVGTDAEQTRRFMQSAATTVSSLPQQDLRLSVERAARILKPSGEQFGHLDRILYRLDPLTPKLQRDAPKAAAALHKLRPAVIHLHELLVAADPVVHELKPAVHSLDRAAVNGVPVIHDLNPSLERLATKVLPGLAKTYPEENLPVYKMIGPTLEGVGTLAGFVDGQGELANLTAGLGEEQAPQFLPCTLDFSGADALVCASLSDALQILFGGGPSVLKQLSERPGGQAIYGPRLTRMHHLQGRFAEDKAALANVRPSLAKWLFEPNHGRGR